MLPAPPQTLSAKTGSALVAGAVCIAFCIGILGFKEVTGVARVDLFFYDQFTRFQKAAPPPDSVTVVDIDDASLAMAGQWPWPRYRIADLITRIAEMNPAAIGLDIIFSEPDRTSLATIRQNYKNDFGLDISFQGVPEGLTDNDGYLGHVLATTGTVGARYFYFDHTGGSSFCREQALDISGRLDLLTLHEAPGILCNTPKVERRLNASGFINNQLDDDGMLRRVPLLLEYGGRISPNLSLATVLRSLDISAIEIDRSVYGPTIRFDSYEIPITRAGYASLHFTNPAQKLPTHSALDIFNGSADPADLAGKIVFVGSSAAGLNDLIPTVLDPMFPGVQTHAVLVGNILANGLIIRPDWAGWLVLAACTVTGLVMGIIFIRSSSPLSTFLASLTLCCAFIAITWLLFNAADLFLSPGPPVLSAVILFALLSSARFAIEKRMAFQWLRQLTNTQQVTMESMANVAETRDPETGAHIKRTQHFVKEIAEQLRRTGQFPDILNDDYIVRLYLSAPLHDIGKVGVPDNILLKPGKLTEEEFELMKKHTDYGHTIISSTVRKIEGDNFLRLAGEIAYTHHEKWDGSGYPRGLRMEDIPLSGRIMAVADVYDALTSKRHYKPPFSHEKAKSIMEESRGAIFDPAVFDAFIAIEDSIIAIAADLKDEENGDAIR